MITTTTTTMSRTHFVIDAFIVIIIITITMMMMTFSRYPRCVNALSTVWDSFHAVLAWVTETPSTGLRHPSSNLCHKSLRHKSQLTEMFLLVLKQQQVCNRQLRLCQV